jgi:PDZ domain-containing protein
VAAPTAQPWAATASLASAGQADFAAESADGVDHRAGRHRRLGPRLRRGLRNASPRTATLALASAVTVAALSALATLPVPYILETPGPTVDTLGEQDGKELIQVPDEPSHPITGELRLTTVGAFGSDPGSLSLVQLLKGYFDPDDALLPYDLLYPPDSTAEQRAAQSEEQMASSQMTATAAALGHLGLPVGIVVEAPLSDPAKAVFRKDDRLVAVAGRPISGDGDVKAALAEVEPGEEVAVTVERDGVQRQLSVVTVSQDDGGPALLGVTITFDFPIEVKFGVAEIGGPSAGSMFALGIIDKLGPADLAAGRVVAGTGTVDPAGQIGAIGGIEQKMIAAKRDGAEIFLAPAANCAEVVGHEPPGLRVVKVATLDDAVRALAAIGSGQGETAAAPACG